MSHNASLLLFALIAIVALVVLIARFKLHPFLGLMLAAIAIGFHSEMKLSVIAKTFQEGVGNTLGFLGVVVGLGIILGKMLAESGGAHVISQHFLRWLGPKRLPWAMLFIALVVGIPVLFAVGLVLLVPIVYAIARETKTPLLMLGIPLYSDIDAKQRRGLRLVQTVVIDQLKHLARVVGKLGGFLVEFGPVEQGHGAPGLIGGGMEVGGVWRAPGARPRGGWTRGRFGR